MPQVILTDRARQGIERCRRFLQVKNPLAARHAGKTIMRQLFSLKTMPDIGRPVSKFPDLRELVIPFGNSGYVALYRHNPSTDRIYVLAFRHQKEAGYGN